MSHPTEELVQGLTVNQGKSFSVPVLANAGTGFLWKLNHASPELVLENSHTIAPHTGLVGAPGQQVYTFIANTMGDYEIVLQYARPWETVTGLVPPAKRVRVQVHVVGPPDATPSLASSQSSCSCTAPCHCDKPSKHPK